MYSPGSGCSQHGFLYIHLSTVDVYISQNDIADESEATGLSA